VLAWKGPEPPPDADHSPAVWKAALASPRHLHAYVVRAGTPRASGDQQESKGDRWEPQATRKVLGERAAPSQESGPSWVTVLGRSLPVLAFLSQMWQLAVMTLPPTPGLPVQLLMVTACSGEPSDSWVTGWLLTDHLAVGGLGELTTALPRLSLFPAPTAALPVVLTTVPEALWDDPPLVGSPMGDGWGCDSHPQRGTAQSLKGGIRPGVGGLSGLQSPYQLQGVEGLSPQVRVRPRCLGIQKHVTSHRVVAPGEILTPRQPPSWRTHMELL
jgi:hypothetical protein